jgi:lipoprotein-anchoring transpeptidase ErfK/SrfK
MAGLSPGYVVLSETMLACCRGQTVRYSLRASTVALLLATVFGTAESANAQYFGGYGGYGGYYGGYARSPAYYPGYSGRHQRAVKRSSHSSSPEKRAATTDARTPAPPPPKGPLTIAISIAKQRLTVYDQDKPIMEAPVSTGMPGHPTPMGIFSVIQKERFHRSNIYSGAPMPFMQRITWSGVAMHEGVLPGHPASHGCIRMPGAFAVTLFKTTKVGVRVLIAQNMLAPTEFSHPRLFTPVKPEPVATLTPTDVVPPITGRQFAASENTLSQSGTGTDRVLDVPALTVGGPARSAGDMPATDAAKPAAQAAPAAAPAASESRPAAMPVIMAPFPAVARPDVSEKPLKPGPIAVFVSRKERKLFVRKGFEPVFNAPVTIANPDQPLGNHVFTAVELINDGAAMRWLAVTMPAERRVVDRSHNNSRNNKGRRNTTVEVVQTVVPPSASDALDRIEIPQEILTRISELLTPGASLTISDQGLGPETGSGTDFIVLTR